MYKQLQTWADQFEPLERPEEIEIINNTKNDEELIEIMLKHNARMIIKEISKWQYTYDLDEAASIVIQKLIRCIDKWDKKSSFYYFAILRIKSALHDATRKYSKWQCDNNGNMLDDIDNHSANLINPKLEQYDDIFEYCKEILTESEYKMIYEIYFNGNLIKNSSNIASSSRKHQRILRKLHKYMKNEGN